MSRMIPVKNVSPLTFQLANESSRGNSVPSFESDKFGRAPDHPGFFGCK